MNHTVAPVWVMKLDWTKYAQGESQQVAQRADASLEAGDLAAWKRVLRTIEKLQRTEPDGAVH